MEEGHGEKAEFGETGHFRAGVINPGHCLGRTFGNANLYVSSRGGVFKGATPCHAASGIFVTLLCTIGLSI